MAAYAGLVLFLSLWAEEVALLSRSIYDIKNRLALTFEVKNATAISEIGIESNVVVGAVVANEKFFIRLCIHKSFDAYLSQVTIMIEFA
jgi:hypothetical protein